MSDDPKTFLTSGRFDYSLNVPQLRAKEAAIFDRDQGNPYGTGIQKDLEDPHDRQGCVIHVAPVAAQHLLLALGLAEVRGHFGGIQSHQERKILFRPGGELNHYRFSPSIRFLHDA